MLLLAAPLLSASPLLRAETLACGSGVLTVSLQQDAPAAKAMARIAIDPASPAKATVVIEENGEDLEVQFDDQPAFASIELRPPRFGVIARTLWDARGFTLRSQRERPATARVSLHCDGTDEARQLIACVSNAGEAAAQSEGSWCTAIRRHNQAFISSRKGDFVSALALYRGAAESWQSRRDAARAGAALLGASESLMNLGRYGESRETAQRSAALSTKAHSTYFALRAKGEACLATRNMGERPAARECLRELPAEYLAIGERYDAANADYNLGSTADEDGDWKDAERWLRAARAIDLGKAPLDITGRLDLLAASLDAADGRLASAMAELDAATELFASLKNDRWLGNVDLRLARLYTHMKAWNESRSFSEDALKRLSTEQSPKRRADAYWMMAIADVALGATDQAREELAQARVLVGDNAPAQQRALDLDGALLLDDHDALARAEAPASTGTPRSNFEAARLALARARNALRNGNIDQASKLAATVHPENLNASDHVLLVETRAQILARSSHQSAALALVEEEIQRLRARAHLATGSGLRYLAGQRLIDLRRVWIDVYLSEALERRPDTESVWRVITDTQPERLLGEMGAPATGNGAADADHELAAALMQDSGDATDDATLRSERALVHYYGALGPATPSTFVEASLASFQSSMPSGTHLLAFAFGTHEGIVLSITRAAAGVRTIAGPSEVRTAADALRTAAASHASSIDAVAVAARRLSEQLLRGETASAPQRLWIVPDQPLSGVPFALLIWPEQSSWLDETTATSIVYGPVGQIPLATQTARVDVLTAGGPVQNGAGSLPGAQLEPAWIAQGMPHASIEPIPLDRGVRSELLDKLQTHGAWIHVAAHGKAKQELHSYSGIWLPGAGGVPEFFSWLDATARPAAADLVVLDACELASGDPRQPEYVAAFATALSAAGVHDVIGALWPVSDAAGALWVPAFYRHLQDNPSDDAADATRAARARLRASRAFQHPFYWASLVHLRH